MMRRLAKDAVILASAVAIAVAIRLFLFAIYAIPSESMLPRLRAGDYLVVARWPYGWSGDGGPLARRLWSGRLSAALPVRGDIVVFKAPPSGRVDYVKRVIGLPGDRIAIRGGIVILNGHRLPHERIGDVIVPASPNSPCPPGQGAVAIDPGRSGPACRYPRFRERLPGGPTYPVIDLGPTEADDFGPVTVPAGRMFVLGDNRDRSADSRFPAREGDGVGMVPLDALIGQPMFVLVSTDGSARIGSPSSWWRAIRRDRVGTPL